MLTGKTKVDDFLKLVMRAFETESKFESWLEIRFLSQNLSYNSKNWIKIWVTTQDYWVKSVTTQFFLVKIWVTTRVFLKVKIWVTTHLFESNLSYDSAVFQFYNKLRITVKLKSILSRNMHCTLTLSFPSFLHFSECAVWCFVRDKIDLNFISYSKLIVVMAQFLSSNLISTEILIQVC